MSEPKDAALDAFLLLVAEKGYGAVTLRDVARQAGLGFADLYALYREKPALLAGFMARVDSEVAAGTPSTDDPEETARDRLFDVMMRRYDSLKQYRAALRSIRRSLLTDPLLALSLAPALRRSMAAMLEAAGVPADGLPGAARQTALLAIHSTVMGAFDQDDSADLSKTMSALDSRLKTAERWAQAVDKYEKYLPLGREQKARQ